RFIATLLERNVFLLLRLRREGGLLAHPPGHGGPVPSAGAPLVRSIVPVAHVKLAVRGQTVEIQVERVVLVHEGHPEPHPVRLVVLGDRPQNLLLLVLAHLTAPPEGRKSKRGAVAELPENAFDRRGSVRERRTLPSGMPDGVGRRIASRWLYDLAFRISD